MCCPGVSLYKTGLVPGFDTQRSLVGKSIPGVDRMDDTKSVSALVTMKMPRRSTRFILKQTSVPRRTNLI